MLPHKLSRNRKLLLAFIRRLSFLRYFSETKLALGCPTYCKFAFHYPSTSTHIQSVMTSTDASKHTLAKSAPFQHFSQENVAEFDKFLAQLNTQKSRAEFCGIFSESLALIDDCLTKHDISKWCVAFNGGKDCTVLLHIIACRLFKKYGLQGLQKLQAFYFQSSKPFPAVDDFVQYTKKLYNIDMKTIKGNVKEGCFELKKKFPHIDHVFMGTRNIDLVKHTENGKTTTNLQPVSQTDSDWPSFHRINPLLKWDYESVWYFLRTLQIPYCKLYDEGYTSLGDYGDTVKNPALKYTDQNHQIHYKPAYELTDGSLERASRIQHLPSE